ncbi:channel accessory protein ArfC [Terrabacter sp. 2YAF2]|uniref:channel accessory protein ArfC n=1 Tax=Terrabacter sp. 2YAF2 TaxID=3233026 RepID=UPI003F983368
MKWLLLAVAFVLGAVTTWFLTVKRVTRVVSAEDQVPGGADGQAAEGTGSSADVEVDDLEDAASAFGGAHTATSDASGAAEAWDRDAEDEDALMSGRADDAPELSMPPVADATPNGDVAGLGDPDGVAAIDEQVEQHTETPKTP